MKEEIWGAIIFIYVLLALPLFSMQAAESDSSTKESISKTSKLTWTWIAGLFIILLAWYFL